MYFLGPECDCSLKSSTAMGSLLSTLPPDPVKVPFAATSSPLLLGDVVPEPATWSNESLCITIRRLFGFLPDSRGEILKRGQQYPLFRREFGHQTCLLNVESIITIQRLYRRYKRLKAWHEVGYYMLQLCRGQIAARQAQERENLSASNFRLLLLKGFSCNKASITGALKTIHLRLVLNAAAGECYLTWTPSRKKKPRINLHDIEQVIAVEKEGNPEAPRLSKKVSYRRGIILVCKRYHRGRMVLEVATKEQRNDLLQGFQRLLTEMDSTEPTLDDAGALRNQQPRRQSVIEFFSLFEETSVPTEESLYQPLPIVDVLPMGTTFQPSNLMPEDFNGSELAGAKSIEHFYHTRFDELPDNTISAIKS